MTHHASPPPCTPCYLADVLQPRQTYSSHLSPFHLCYPVLYLNQPRTSLNMDKLVWQIMYFHLSLNTGCSMSLITPSNKCNHFQKFYFDFSMGLMASYGVTSNVTNIISTMKAIKLYLLLLHAYCKLFDTIWIPMFDTLCTFIPV